MEMEKAFIVGAEAAAALIADPAVAAAWDRPSALAGFRVSGLAGHLASQVTNAPGVLRPEPADQAPRTLLEHYASVQWLGQPPETEANTAIRAGGDELARVGPAELAASVRRAATEVTAILAGRDADDPVLLPWTGWALTTDDYLTTRAMELVVHADDLAYSVGVPTPELPPEVTDPVLALLFGLSLRRHGATAIIRALARAERAPATIAGI